MRGMFPATRTILAELEPIRIIPTILLGGVISLLAVIALQRDDGANIFLLGSHSYLPTFFTIQQFW